MANFAILDNDDCIIRIENIDNSILIDSIDNLEKEINGINYILSLNQELKSKNIVQISFNSNFRGNMPIVGMYYIRNEDGFSIRKNSPYPSWILNKYVFKFFPPVPNPDPDNPLIVWNEDQKKWTELDKNSRVIL